MLSVVMLIGLLQQKNSNFEGITRRKFRKFAAIGYLFPQSGFWPVKQVDGETYIARETEDT